MISTEEKLPCPQHGIRSVQAQRYSTGTWFKCRRCDFRRWVETQSFMVMASMVLIACYVKAWIVILGH
jgi:hypothetical protein